MKGGMRGSEGLQITVAFTDEKRSSSVQVPCHDMITGFYGSKSATMTETWPL